MESREEMGRELTKGQFKFKVFGQSFQTYDCKCVVVRRSLWTLLQFSGKQIRKQIAWVEKYIGDDAIEEAEVFILFLSANCLPHFSLVRSHVEETVNSRHLILGEITGYTSFRDAIRIDFL